MGSCLEVWKKFNTILEKKPGPDSLIIEQMFSRILPEDTDFLDTELKQTSSEEVALTSTYFVLAASEETHAFFNFSLPLLRNLPNSSASQIYFNFPSKCLRVCEVTYLL